MKDCPAARDRTVDDSRVSDIALQLLDPKVVEMLIAPPCQASNPQTSLRDQLDQGRAQETTAARHQNVTQLRGTHDSLLDAQTANFSRKILALWRISTGKDG